MGTEAELQARLEQPLKTRFEKLYNGAYGDRPGPGLGKFIAYLATLGADAFEKRIKR